jgi:hypothetical protein
MTTETSSSFRACDLHVLGLRCPCFDYVEAPTGQSRVETEANKPQCAALLSPLADFSTSAAAAWQVLPRSRRSITRMQTLPYLADAASLAGFALLVNVASLASTTLFIGVVSLAGGVPGATSPPCANFLYILASYACAAL